MTIRVRISVGLLSVFLIVATAAGDEEAANRAHIAASPYGDCYAKSVPAESYGSKGVTKIYSVEATEDKLIATFDWYASDIYLACAVGGEGRPVAASVVRFGPWPRGHQASAKDLAIAFYFGGKLVKQYSTLDIVSKPGNVLASVSHYRVFERVLGYHWRSGNFATFEVVTTTGPVAFDPTTGAIITDPKAMR